MIQITESFVLLDYQRGVMGATEHGSWEEALAS